MFKIVGIAVSVFVLGFVSSVYLLAKANIPDGDTQTTTWQAAGVTVKAILMRDLMTDDFQEDVSEPPHHKLATDVTSESVVTSDALIEISDLGDVELQSHRDIENIHRKRQPGAAPRVIIPSPPEDLAWLNQIEEDDDRMARENVKRTIEESNNQQEQ